MAGEFGRYLEIIEEAKESFAGRVDVRLGLEADYFEGMESFQNSCSPLISTSYWGPCIRRFLSGGKVLAEDLVEVAARTSACWRRLRRFIDSLAHPDLIKNFTAKAWIH